MHLDERHVDAVRRAGRVISNELHRLAPARGGGSRRVGKEGLKRVERGGDSSKTQTAQYNLVVSEDSDPSTSNTPHREAKRSVAAERRRADETEPSSMLPRAADREHERDHDTAGVDKRGRARCPARARVGVERAEESAVEDDVERRLRRRWRRRRVAAAVASAAGGCRRHLEWLEGVSPWRRSPSPRRRTDPERWLKTRRVKCRANFNWKVRCKIELLRATGRSAPKNGKTGCREAVGSDSD